MLIMSQDAWRNLVATREIHVNGSALNATPLSKTFAKASTTLQLTCHVALMDLLALAVAGMDLLLQSETCMTGRSACSVWQ